MSIGRAHIPSTLNSLLIRPGGYKLARIRERLFGIDAAEASFERRGFGPTTPARQRLLEQIGRCFVAGYNAAIRSADPLGVVDDFPTPADELTGFVYEGAAMGFALLDLLAPGRSRRFASFLAATAGPHIYMAYVGAGWALARTSSRLAWRLGSLDPLLRWLMFDGYGFHAGYFHPVAAITRQKRPRGLRDNARPMFDQGLGRAIWFMTGAQAAAVAIQVGEFPPARRTDLWSGVGLAAAYAGAADSSELAALMDASGPDHRQLGLGAAFAAKARLRAGNPAKHTELACQIFCGGSATAAAEVTDRALLAVKPDDGCEAYGNWRAEIRRHLEVRGRAA